MECVLHVGNPKEIEQLQWLQYRRRKLRANISSCNSQFVLTHSAAGAHAFRLLTLTDLTTGKKPILSEEALAILKCDYKEELQDTSELLKRLKEAFDDENISYKDKTTLMLCFLRIKKLLQDLPDDKWATIDRSGSGSSEETDDATSTVRYYTSIQVLTKTMPS